MLLASATTLFVPHAGREPARSANGRGASSAPRPMPPDETSAAGRVSIATTFRLSPAAYNTLIAEAARKYGLEPALLRAVVRIESDFDPLAVSSAGAQGLMQLMPALAAELGVLNPFDPRENLMGGARYLSALLQTYNGDLELALAGYNAGPASVDLYGGVPPFPETQEYVDRVTKRLVQERAAD